MCFSIDGQGDAAIYNSIPLAYVYKLVHYCRSTEDTS